MQVNSGGIDNFTKKTIFLLMENIKNYIIAFLLAVIALILVTQPAQSAGKSVQAKSIEYQACINLWNPSSMPGLDSAFADCAKYRP